MRWNVLCENVSNHFSHIFAWFKSIHLFPNMVHFQFNFCLDTSIGVYLSTEPMVTRSNPSSAKFSLRVMRVASSLTCEAY